MKHSKSMKKFRLHKIQKEEATSKTKGQYVNDLTVNKNHNYTVGNQNISVHNCLTSQQTGVGYAMASLVKECRDAKVEHNLSAKIIADGGMKDYADIIKSLALGADIVILGSVLNKALESCAPTYMENKKHESWTEPGEQIDQYDEKYQELFKSGVQLYKKFRGMSTKGVQKKWGNDKVRTSEGVVRLNPVMYTLSGWRENLEAYLRSAMSYCGASRIEEFIGIPSYTFISENTLKRFRK